ncbi:MAG: hypothetical protein D6714_18720, partial [Bacteroidetes bacterium]
MGAPASLIPPAVWAKWTGKPCFFPFYHAVGEPADLPHIRPLYRPRSVRRFREDLDFFLTHFEPLSLEMLAEVLRRERVLRRPAFFLSFDDGLREVYD